MTLKIKTTLSVEKAYPWQQSKTDFFRGFLCHQKEKLSGLVALNHLKKNYHDNQKLTALDGHFSASFQVGDTQVIIQDRTRSFPLFYQLKENTLTLSDHPSGPLTSGYKNLFLQSAFVPSDATFYPDWKGIEAGECLQINLTTGALKKHFYDCPNQLTYLNKPDTEQYKTLLTSLKDYIEVSCKNRQIVLPLSGGYDSRILACLLHDMNVKNVICYTYGVEDSHEVKRARKVADTLGYRWEFITYNTRSWEEVFTHLPQFMPYSFRGVSCPHIQDFYAVHTLKTKKLINDDAIFIPGHGGDFLGGSHLPYPLPRQYSEKNFKKYILKHLFRFNLSESKLTPKDLGSFWSKDYPKMHSMQDYLTFIDDWNMKERQAKFIINSVRVFEYFGYEWTLPLSTSLFYNFWRAIPYPLRLENGLYNNLHNQLLFQPKGLGLDSFKPLTHRQPFKYLLSQSPKRLEEFLRYFLKTNFKANDYNGLDGFKLKLIEKLDQVPSYSDRNEHSIMSRYVLKVLGQEKNNQLATTSKALPASL